MARIRKPKAKRPANRLHAKRLARKKRMIKKNNKRA